MEFIFEKTGTYLIAAIVGASFAWFMNLLAQKKNLQKIPILEERISVLPSMESKIGRLESRQKEGTRQCGVSVDLERRVKVLETTSISREELKEHLREIKESNKEYRNELKESLDKITLYLMDNRT